MIVDQGHREAHVDNAFKGASLPCHFLKHVIFVLLYWMSHSNIDWLVREKRRDLTQSCDKNSCIHRTIQKAAWQHKNATQNLDYKTIADRLWTVSWRNDSNQLVWLNWFTGFLPFH